MNSLSPSLITATPRWAESGLLKSDSVNQSQCFLLLDSVRIYKFSKSIKSVQMYQKHSWYSEIEVSIDQIKPKIKMSQEEMKRHEVFNKTSYSPT